MTWQPLPVRQGNAEPTGPYEGVPPHLAVLCRGWVAEVLNRNNHSEKTAQVLAAMLRLPVGDRGAVDAVRAVCTSVLPTSSWTSWSLLLHTYNPWQHGKGKGAELRVILELGGSVWTVAEDDGSLVRRVSETEQKAYEAVVCLNDEVAEELRTAWSEVYGRNPDPSDAWDHAIKPVELTLWPIVTPNDSDATLGKIAGQLGSQSGRFTFRLATSSNRVTKVETLVQMSRLMWPNPDRHGTGSKRTPTQEEAENVVQLAVLIVGWLRTKALASTTV